MSGCNPPPRYFQLRQLVQRDQAFWSFPVASACHAWPRHAERGTLKVYDKLECRWALPAAQTTPAPNNSRGASQTRAAYLSTVRRYSLILWE